MHVKKDDVPLVANPSDQLWIVFRDQSALGVVWVESLSDSAVVTVQDGPSDDPSLLGAGTTLTFTQATVKQLVQLPPSGNIANRYVRVAVTSGRVSVAMAAPSEFRHYMKVLTS